MGALEFYEGKRESYWTYRVDLPAVPGERRRQKRITRDRTTGKRWTSKKACRTAMQEHEAELRTGSPIIDSTITTGEHVARWLDRSIGRISPSTNTAYRAAWARLEDSLGPVRVQLLTPLMIQEAFDTLGQTYAPKTQRVTYSVLHNALEQAVKWEVLPRNPCAGVILPAARPRAVRIVWTSQEAQAFLISTKDHDLQPLWRLLLDSGMRIGEVLALTWAHVALNGDWPTVRVERTIINVDGHWEFGAAPKSARGRRTIHIQPETAAALKAHQLRQEAMRRHYGAHWMDLDLVFPRNDGAIMHPSTLRSSQARACRKARVPCIPPHGLRHTMATLAAQRGVPLKLLADRMGHSGVGLVSTLYAHATDEGDQAVASALRGLF